MKQDNAFRFVALRGPEQLPERPREPVPIPGGPANPPPSSVPIPIRPGDNTFIDSIRARVEGGATLNEARTAVVTEFLASPEYVPRSPTWRGLLELHGPLIEELGSTNASSDPVAARSAVERILSRHFGRDFDLRKFAHGEEFRKLSRNVWHSYYANVALPARRPQDRSLLEFWLRLFEVIGGLSAEYPWVPSMTALRPVVPLVLLQEKRPERELPEPVVPPPRHDQILNARKTLAELKAVEAELKRLYEASLVEPPAGGAPQTQQSAARSITSLDDPREPWTIQESNLSAATRQILTREYIALSNRPLPSIIDDVQKRIAKAYLRLHGLERVTEVVLAGGVYVRRRRKIRVTPA